MRDFNQRGITNCHYHVIFWKRTSHSCMLPVGLSFLLLYIITKA